MADQQPFQRYEDDQRDQSMQQQVKGHLIAAVSELIGTTSFLWFAFAATQAAVQNGTPATSTDGLMFISLSFGFSLMVTVWAHYRISGGLFNPAVSLSASLLTYLLIHKVTLALVITNNLDWVRGLYLLPGQVLGGIVASALVQWMIPGPLVVVNRLSEETSIIQGLFIEAFGTLLLVFVILMLAAEKHETTPLAPVGIGLALFVGELGCVRYTGGALNPARALGPSVASMDFPSYHYIYW